MTAALAIFALTAGLFDPRTAMVPAGCVETAARRPADSCGPALLEGAPRLLDGDARRAVQQAPAPGTEPVGGGENGTSRARGSGGVIATGARVRGPSS